MKKDGSSSVHLGVTAALGEYFVSTSEKGGYTENHADVPVIFSDKGIDLAVQMYTQQTVGRVELQSAISKYSGGLRDRQC